MLAPWLSYSIATSTLAGAAAVAAESLVATWRLPRRGVWLAAIILSIGAPIFVAFRAPSGVEGQAVSPPLTAYARGSVEANTTSPRPVLAGDSRRALATAAVNDRHLFQIWGVCSASLFALLLIGARRLHQQARGWRLTAIDGGVVFVAPEAGPAVVGFIRPRVVLPAWSLSLDSPALSLILRHEREHIRARDPLLLLFAALSIALLPWNVALWFMARRLVLAVELDCDQRVLRTTTSVREYGLMLLEVVRRRGVHGLLLGASLIRPRGFLARRIHAMITLDTRRPRLATLALATSLIALTVAATRVPRPATLRTSSTRSGASTSEIAHIAAASPPVPATVGARHDTPERRGGPIVLAREEPKPRVTVNWESAPIELVVAAFARFSGRKINTAPDVNGPITARVDDQPWDEALAWVMSLNGYRVVVHSDSSITIVAVRSSRSENRRVSGRVIDERTKLPIVGALVNVAGTQAIGEANRTCTTDGGSFELTVPEGEVWLDATAAGYEFSRVTLAPHENRALFVGRVSARGRAVTTIRNLRPNYVWAVRSTPIMVIDGAVASPDHFDVGPCSDR